MYDGKMESTDQEKELQRMTELYSSMPDAKLQELAKDSAELTDLAHTALKAEINRRGLKTVSEGLPMQTDPVEEPELTTIRRFRDLPEAILAKGLLESAGIECYLADDNIVRLDWFLSNAIGNMRLQVKPADAETAIEILDQLPTDISEDGA
jgi:hypothetical protein